MEFVFEKQPGKKINQPFITEITEVPLMTIITPFYNAGKYFEQTFNCVINQTFIWFEWIIVDDGSTNEKDVEFLDKLSSQDARIKVYHVANRGPAAARNYAISKATTDLIVSLDADDLIEPVYLDQTYFALSVNPDATWAYTDSLGFEQQNYVWKQKFDDEKLKKENFLIEVGTFRKSAFDAVGGYDDAQKHSHEDWNLWLSFMTQGGFPVHISSLSSWYRRVDDGAFHQTDDNQEVKDNAFKRIEETTKKITQKIEAIEFPKIGEKEKLYAPKCSNWERKKVKDKIEVLMLIPWMEMGGADLFNLEMVKLINKEEFHVGVMTTLNCENSLRQRFMDYVDDLYELPTFMESKDYPEFISYYIKSRQVDVVFVSNSYFGYYLIPWLKKEFPNIKIVDCFHIEEWYWKSGGYSRCSKVFEHFTEKTYVSTEHLKNVLIEKFNRPEQDIDVVYTGVDEKKFDATLVERGKIRKESGIPDDAKVVLFVCRIHPQKRPYLMVEIAKRLIEQDEKIHFLVVGEGPDQAGVKEKIKGYGLKKHVTFYDNQEDLRPFYKDSDVMLLCSIKEGISITTLEACSMGLPIVSSDVGGQGEVVDSTVGALLPMLQDEAADFNARTFSEEEIQQYVDAIRTLLSDEKEMKNKSVECRKKIEEKFSTSIMIHKFENDFREFVSDSYKKDYDYKAQYESLVNDFVTTYNELFIYENVAIELWDGMNWFKKLATEKPEKYNQMRESVFYKFAKKVYRFLVRKFG